MKAASVRSFVATIILIFLAFSPNAAPAQEMIVDVPTPSLDIPDIIKSIKPAGGTDEEIARLAPKYHRAALGVLNKLFHLIPEPKELPYLYEGAEYNKSVWIGKRNCGAVKSIRGYYAEPSYPTQADEGTKITAFPNKAKAGSLIRSLVGGWKRDWHKMGGENAVPGPKACDLGDECFSWKRKNGPLASLSLVARYKNMVIQSGNLNWNHRSHSDIVTALVMALKTWDLRPAGTPWRDPYQSPDTSVDPPLEEGRDTVPQADDDQVDEAGLGGLWQTPGIKDSDWNVELKLVQKGSEVQVRGRTYFRGSWRAWSGSGRVDGDKISFDYDMSAHRALGWADGRVEMIILKNRKLMTGFFRSQDGRWMAPIKVSRQQAGLSEPQEPEPREPKSIDAGGDNATPGPAAVNLALGKMATQSSLGWGGEAHRAVDGKTSGNYNSQSVTHTNADKGAWWQVDLGDVYDIEKIIIWNRTDCCGERLSNFVVLVAPNPLVSTDLETARKEPGVWPYTHTGPAGVKTEIPVRARGQYIRIQLAGQNYLSLAEVEVLGH